MSGIVKRISIIALFSATCWLGLPGMHDNEDFTQKHIQKIKKQYAKFLPITRELSHGIVRAYHQRAIGATHIFIAYNNQTYERAMLAGASAIYTFNARDDVEGVRWTAEIYNDTRKEFETRVKNEEWILLKLD